MRSQIQEQFNRSGQDYDMEFQDVPHLKFHDMHSLVDSNGADCFEDIDGAGANPNSQNNNPDFNETNSNVKITYVK